MVSYLVDHRDYPREARVGRLTQLLDDFLASLDQPQLVLGAEPAFAPEQARRAPL